MPLIRRPHYTPPPLFAPLRAAFTFANMSCHMSSCIHPACSASSNPLRRTRTPLLYNKHAVRVRTGAPNLHITNIIMIACLQAIITVVLLAQATLQCTAQSPANLRFSRFFSRLSTLFTGFNNRHTHQKPHPSVHCRHPENPISSKNGKLFVLSLLYNATTPVSSHLRHPPSNRRLRVQLMLLPRTSQRPPTPVAASSPPFTFVNNQPNSISLFPLSSPCHTHTRTRTQPYKNHCRCPPRRTVKPEAYSHIVANISHHLIHMPVSRLSR